MPGHIVVFPMLLRDFLHILFTIFSILLYNMLSFKFIQHISKITCIALLIALLHWWVRSKCKIVEYYQKNKRT